MTKAKSEPTIAQQTYVEQHYQTMSPQQLTSDTGLPLSKVKAIIKKLVSSTSADAGQKTKKMGVNQAGFDIYNGQDADGSPGQVGTVSMTQAASATGDKLNGERDKSRNDTFFKSRVRNGIHIIDPEKPVY